jgi:hypothetical protein
VKGNWRKLHYALRIKEAEIGGACGTHGREEKR